MVTIHASGGWDDVLIDRRRFDFSMGDSVILKADKVNKFVVVFLSHLTNMTEAIILLVV